ncbi:PucR family transcriptional regulator [Streptomyces sp. NPDC005009]
MEDTAPRLSTVPPATGADLGAVLGHLAGLLGSGPAWCGGTDARISDVVIAEPGEPLGDLTGALVLAVGAREPEAEAMVGAAGAAGAAAVAVRTTDPELPPQVRTAAAHAGVAALGIPPDLRWDRAEAEIRAVLARDGTAMAADRRSDLFALAHTVATLTHGVVSVEDAAHRLLAYAGPGDEADELRRASVLGRSCPEPYLALLRREGVQRRIREGDDVVEVAEQPAMGARRRLVVGINAERRHLGTIWVQEGGRPLADRAAEMVQGAARLAAAQLVDHYFQGDATARLASREELSHGLLTGRYEAAAIAAHLGIAPTASADVVAVDLRERPGTSATTADARCAEAAGIISVHAAARWDNPLAVQACGQIYVILPAPPVTPGTTREPAGEEPLLRWAGDLVTVLRRQTGTPVQAVVAGRAERLVELPTVKLRGHHGLELLSRTPQTPVGTHRLLTPALVVRDTLDLMQRAGVHFPAVAALVERDHEQGTDTARSLLLYLDAFGDVGSVAKQLNVHPNTLRYRVRRAVEFTGLDLTDPEHRLAATLQLRLGLDHPPRSTTAFPQP